MKLFSSEEIEAIKKATLKEKGISLRQFIESVGELLAAEVEAGHDPGHELVVLAGPGNNGAYALSMARHLHMKGLRPMVIFFNIGGNRAGSECLASRDLMVAECGADSITEVTGMSFSMPELGPDVTVVDGLFGSERTTPLSGGYQSIVRYINETGAKVVAIDVPSGLLVDSPDALINRNIIHATTTLAIGLPRLAFLMKENAELLGTWKVLDVGLSPEAISRMPWRYRMVEKADIRHIIRPRDPFASKADCGDAVLFTGSYGMLGAAQLCAQGCLRGGAGKVTVHAPRCAFYVMQTAVPCAMFECDPGDVAITDIELSHDFRAVAIGPGIGTADATIDALHAFLRIANANSRPIILDADALNCMSIRPAMLDHIPVMSILTPHPGEFDRLFGKQPSSAARLQKAVEESRKRQIIIILKGKYTAIVRPDGKVYFNPTGSCALATGGSGDVLSGLLAAFLAQGMRPEFAAIAAPYIHGLAGEIAARTHSVYSVTASDVALNIGPAILATTEIQPSES